MKSLKGTGVALVTPFNQSGDIDYNGLTKLLNHTASDVDYYVIQGTTGESATTSIKEKQAILNHVINNNPNGLPIVYGIGGNDTLGVVDTISKTDLCGVDAILSVSPYYNKPSQEGIIAHFTKIANECPVPIILYNVPGRTASNLVATTTIKLSKHANIIGVKEASGNVEQSMEIVNNTDNDFLVISGDDMLTPALMAIGAVGVISVLANAYPKVFKEMITRAFENDFVGASNIINQLATMNPLMYEESNPVGIKEVLHQMNVCENFVRLPLLPASTGLSKKIKEVF